MARYQLLITYDGTAYSGWQVQPNGIAIQQLIQSALTTALRTPITIHGSGRTDAGVHALGQVAHFDYLQPIDPFRLIHSLNGMLPKDIRILNIACAEESFHARYSAISKVYHYHLWLDPVENPFVMRYRWHLHRQIDLTRLQDAANELLGTRDFYAFANESHRGSAAHDSVRTMQRIDIVPQEGGVRLEFQADGFLYKMVRNIVGTLVEVANGRREVSNLSKLFALRDRRQVGQAAPPQGLFLVKVEYP